MKSFKLDKDNNIITSGGFAIEEDLLQDINTSLGLLKGEYPFNSDEGIDYLGEMQNMETLGLINEVIARVLEDDRVLEVKDEIIQDYDKIVLRLNIRTATEEVMYERAL